MKYQYVQRLSTSSQSPQKNSGGSKLSGSHGSRPKLAETPQLGDNALKLPNSMQTGEVTCLRRVFLKLVKTLELVKNSPNSQTRCKWVMWHVWGGPYASYITLFRELGSLGWEQWLPLTYCRMYGIDREHHAERSENHKNSAHMARYSFQNTA